MMIGSFIPPVGRRKNLSIPANWVTNSSYIDRTNGIVSLGVPNSGGSQQVRIADLTPGKMYILRWLSSNPTLEIGVGNTAGNYEVGRFTGASRSITFLWGAGSGQTDIRLRVNTAGASTTLSQIELYALN